MDKTNKSNNTACCQPGCCATDKKCVNVCCEKECCPEGKKGYEAPTFSSEHKATVGASE
jgi:hypothetical protein